MIANQKTILGNQKKLLANQQEIKANQKTIIANQKKILGLVPATDAEKASARKTALYASRTNFILSFPMLLCMGGQGHGLGF